MTAILHSPRRASRVSFGKEIMIASPKMTAELILERLEVIGGSAHERESDNETAERLLAFLVSHINGNEDEIKKALLCWIEAKAEPKLWIGSYLMKKLTL